MTLLARLGTLLAFVAAGGAQYGLQQRLGRDNRARAVLEVHTAPASLPFRLAAGGVKEAAGDALWLTVLPRLGKDWLDRERKLRWVEAVARVLVDTDPRAITAPLYASTFLELLDIGDPAVIDVLEHAIHARVRGEPVNEDNVDLLQQLGMVYYARHTRGDRDALEPALRWLRKAAALPDCPTIVVDFVGELSRRQGNPLDGWLLYRTRAEGTSNPDHRKFYFREGEALRRRVLLRWAGAAEARLGRWPEEVRELYEEIPEKAREEFQRDPALFRDFLEREVIFVPETRDLYFRDQVIEDEKETREALQDWIDYHRQEKGVPPATLEDLTTLEGFHVPLSSRHGTRWDLGEDGAPALVPHPDDPRIRHRMGHPGETPAPSGEGGGTKEGE